MIEFRQYENLFSQAPAILDAIGLNIGGITRSPTF